jgi:putative colanic acid biosynthesis acetyltransferase WcaF|tara:strand:+ start:2453 stop:3004 length:552 start_codon:yes stop_codon:yes gene_type:complete
MNLKSDFSKFNNSNFKPGNILLRIIWQIFNVVFLKSNWLPFSFVKVFILKIFGAKIGKYVVIKPSVNIKYPWKLSLADHVWIGENVWIDNLDHVKIGNNVCISQGAFLLCGNHNYKSESFDLITKPIVIEEGVWIGAKSIVLPGVIAKSHSILSAASVTSKDLEPFSIYKGNPAEKVSTRTIS